MMRVNGNFFKSLDKVIPESVFSDLKYLWKLIFFNSNSI